MRLNLKVFTILFLVIASAYSSRLDAGVEFSLSLVQWSSIRFSNFGFTQKAMPEFYPLLNEEILPRVVVVGWNGLGTAPLKTESTFSRGKLSGISKEGMFRSLNIGSELPLDCEDQNLMLSNMADFISGAYLSIFENTKTSEAFEKLQLTHLGVINSVFNSFYWTSGLVAANSSLIPIEGLELLNSYLRLLINIVHPDQFSRLLDGKVDEKARVSKMLFILKNELKCQRFPANYNAEEFKRFYLYCLRFIQLCFQHMTVPELLRYKGYLVETTLRLVDLTELLGSSPAWIKDYRRDPFLGLMKSEVVTVEKAGDQRYLAGALPIKLKKVSDGLNNGNGKNSEY